MYWVLLCVIRESLQLQLNCIGDKSRQLGSSLPSTLTDRPACSATVPDTQQTATAAQGSYRYMRQSTFCSRDKHLVRPFINKTEIEGNYVPPMPGMLSKKWKCKQMVWVTGKARTKHDKIQLMTYIQFIQQCWRKKKEKNKKLNVFKLHNSANTSISLSCRNNVCFAELPNTDTTELTLWSNRLPNWIFFVA